MKGMRQCFGVILIILLKRVDRTSRFMNTPLIWDYSSESSSYRAQLSCRNVDDDIEDCNEFYVCDSILVCDHLNEIFGTTIPHSSDVCCNNV